LLALGLLVAACAAIVWQPFAWLAFACGMLLGLTTVPFTSYCLTRDWRVALVAPVTLGLIAYAAGAGALVGLLTRMDR
jgi:hypothetical protein